MLYKNTQTNMSIYTGVNITATIWRGGGMQPCGPLPQKKGRKERGRKERGGGEIGSGNAQVLSRQTSSNHNSVYEPDLHINWILFV